MYLLTCQIMSFDVCELSLGSENAPHQVAPGTLYILVPQSVDERVECRGHHSIEESHELGLVPRDGGRGLKVHANGWTIKEEIYNEMGGTCAKGFFSSLQRFNLKYSMSNRSIGNKNEA